MGTTLTALSILGTDGFIVHVGDCRAYLFRDGKLEQLTRDHTVAEELVGAGTDCRPTRRGPIGCATPSRMSLAASRASRARS